MNTCLGTRSVPAAFRVAISASMRTQLAPPAAHLQTRRPTKPLPRQRDPDGAAFAAGAGALQAAAAVCSQRRLPTAAGNTGMAANYNASGQGIFNADQWDVRGDFQVTQKIHAFGRFSRFTDTLTGTTIFGAAGGTGFGLNNYGGTSVGANDSVAAGADMAVNATLLTDFRLGYYRYNAVTSKYDQGTTISRPAGYPGFEPGAGFTSGASAFNIEDPGRTGVATLNPRLRRRSAVWQRPERKPLQLPAVAARGPVPGREQLDQDPRQPLDQVRRRSSLRAQPARAERRESRG